MKLVEAQGGRRERGEIFAQSLIDGLVEELCDALEQEALHLAGTSALKNYQLVGPAARAKLKGLIEFYRKKAHPFTACVPGSTLVETDRGPRPISRLRSGDRVWSRDQDSGAFQVNEIIWAAVTRKHAHLVEAKLDDGTTVVATPDHRVMLASGEWAELGSLRQGDLLLSSPSFSFALASEAVAPSVGSNTAILTPEVSVGTEEGTLSDPVLDDLVLGQGFVDLRHSSRREQWSESFHDGDAGVSVDAPVPSSVATLVNPVVQETDAEDGGQLVQGLSILLHGRDDQGAILSPTAVPVPAETPFSLHESCRPRQVQSVVLLGRREDVWDIEVAKNHNFISSGVVFHNCVTDNTQRFGADRAKKVCAVLTDLEKNTTKWRSGGNRGSSLAEVITPQPNLDAELFDLLNAVAEIDYIEILRLYDISSEELESYIGDGEELSVVSGYARSRMPSTAFALPKQRKYLMHDRQHAGLAIGRAKGKPEFSTVKAAVCKRHPTLPACEEPNQSKGGS